MRTTNVVQLRDLSLVVSEITYVSLHSALDESFSLGVGLKSGSTATVGYRKDDLKTARADQATITNAMIEYHVQ